MHSALISSSILTKFSTKMAPGIVLVVVVVVIVEFMAFLMMSVTLLVVLILRGRLAVQLFLS